MTDDLPARREYAPMETGDRYVFVGKTGSGKTYAAQNIIWQQAERVIFHDYKEQHADELNAPVLNSLDAVHEALFAENPEERLYKFAYVPNPTADDYAEWDELCRLVFQKGDIHLMGDEIKGIYQDGNSTRPITDWHEAIMTRGRARGAGISNLSQRPHKIPLEVFSEAEHIFAFRLNLSNDRDRIGEIVGPASEKCGNFSTGEHLYYYEDWDEPATMPPI